jgi:2-isopropylmalate synthase
VRSRPQTLGRLFRSVIEAGARRLCLCDTVGHATPDGVKNVVRFTRNLVDSLGADVGVEWHGHNDRGFALVNALMAVEAGVDRVHGTARGIGERVGNTPMDLLLVNLKLLGVIDNDLTRLHRYVKTAAEAMACPIPHDYPVVGRDAFRTATGVHAAAVIKAARKGDTWLADRVYSGVPAAMVGREQDIEVGHYSGESNVMYWLERRGIAPERELVKAVFDFAKSTNRVLSDTELLAFIEQHETRRSAL